MANDWSTAYFKSFLACSCAFFTSCARSAGMMSVASSVCTTISPSHPTSATVWPCPSLRVPPVMTRLSVLSTITVLELVARAKDVGIQTFRYLEPLTMAGILFWMVSYTAAHFIRRLEDKNAR